MSFLGRVSTSQCRLFLGHLFTPPVRLVAQFDLGCAQDVQGRIQMMWRHGTLQLASPLSLMCFPAVVALIIDDGLCVFVC